MRQNRRLCIVGMFAIAAALTFAVICEWPVATPKWEPQPELLMSVRALSSRFHQEPLMAHASIAQLLHGLYAHAGDFLVAIGPLRIGCLTWLRWRAASVTDWGILARTDDGWTFAEAESHRGQFLFKLAEAGVKLDHATIDTPDGQVVKLNDLIRTLQREVSEVSDLDYLLPVLCRFGDSAWTTQYGEDWTTDRLVQTHLAHRDTARTCLGAHWRLAIAYIVRDRPPAIARTTMKRCRAILLEEFDLALSRQHSTGFLAPMPLPAPLPQTATLSFHAHTLEWLLIAAEFVDRDTRREFELAVHWLVDEANRLWSESDYLTKCHVVRALRRFEQATELSCRRELTCSSNPT